MRKKYFIFIVNGVVPGDSGRITVIGRCGDFPIAIGDEFDRVFRHRARKLPEEAGQAPVREVEEPVSLRVVCIHAYEHSIPELGEGVTGSLVLDGEGSGRVVPGWILGTLDDGPPGALHHPLSVELSISG